MTEVNYAKEWYKLVFGKPADWRRRQPSFRMEHRLLAFNSKVDDILHEAKRKLNVVQSDADIGIFKVSRLIELHILIELESNKYTRENILPRVNFI